uniref:Homeodomain protein HD2 n=1 Tax=Auricularia auricula-judae TaxID=29892 RepID=A0A6M8PVY1_AURAJ|nr:homeodomain protein HD2 [Auricularia auricula-judae]
MVKVKSGLKLQTIGRKVPKALDLDHFRRFLLFLNLATGSSMEALISSATRLQHKLAAHLGVCAPSPRRCYDPTLQLPSPSSISDLLRGCGASGETARRLSDLYVESSLYLRTKTQEQFLGALDDLRDSHDYCHHGVSGCYQVCPITQGLCDTFLRTYRCKEQALIDEAVRLVQHDNRPPPLATNLQPVTDYLPILEFAFEQSPRPTAHDRALLSLVTGRSEKQISIWFQNRRARAKAATSSRREPPRTIEQLGNVLIEQQRFAVTPTHDGDCSDSEAHDSGYASASSVCSVDDLAKLLERFHLSDAPKLHGAARQRKAGHNMGARRISTSSEESTGHRKMRNSSGDARRKTSSRAGSTAPPCHTEAANKRPVTGRVAPRAASSEETWSYPAVAAVSSNKAHRPRRRAPLPSRRPSCMPRNYSSSSSCPSLTSSTASSRVSSLSSDASSATQSPRSAISPKIADTKQLYYRDANTGDFVPIVGTSMLVVSPSWERNEVAQPTSASMVPVADAIILGSPRQPLFAPDNDPRAFSSNILQTDAHSSSESPVRTAPPLDYSCPNTDSPDSTLPVAVSTTPDLLDPLDATASDLWVHDSAPLDIINYAYDQSWSTTVGQANSWAQLLGVARRVHVAIICSHAVLLMLYGVYLYRL